MAIEVIEKENVVIMKPNSTILGGPDAIELNEEIHQQVRNGKNNYLLDLSAIELMNSSGLGILISNLTTVRNQGGDLRLVHVSEKVEHILKIARISSVFTIYNDLDEAVTSFS